MSIPPVRIEVTPDSVVAHVSRHMTGACIEDVNHELYGGIYSQMIFGESFAEPPAESGVSGMWRPVQSGTAVGEFKTVHHDLLDSPQAQRVAFLEGMGEVGVANEGLNRWGMCFRKGKSYEGLLWAKSAGGAQLCVSLESKEGKARYAEKSVAVPAGDWTQVAFKLTPTGDEPHGRFAITLRKPGEVLLGYAFLEPGPWGRFKGLPVRKDVAEALVAQGLTVLRLGGSMINSPNYRWKHMIGPRDRRKPHEGTWYRYSSNGWGIVEFMGFCEAAGFLGIPDLNMDETPADVADFVEYMNGKIDTPWGARRAADGHPKPYELKYIELGNEEAVNDAYWARFEPLARAIWAKDPSVVIVVGDFCYSQEIKDPWSFSGGAVVNSLSAHKKILELAKAEGKSVWFDLHVGNDDPHQVFSPEGGYFGLLSYVKALKQISPGADFKIAVFEENAGNHQVRRALGHALMVDALERAGDDVRIVCAANCLQPDGQNDNGWDQGLLFLSPRSVWGQGAYYVTQMLARYYLPLCVKASSSSADLDVTAKRSEDGQVLQVQVVNMSDAPIAADLSFGDWAPKESSFRVVSICGDWNAVNTEREPRKVVSKSSVRKVGTRPSHTFPARSFTILRFE